LNSVLKQRLVGATVIVALGVIFVPMLLERGADDSRVSVRMEIPPKPDLSIRDKLDDPPEIKPIEILEPIDKAIEAARPSVSATKPKPRPDSSVTKPIPQISSGSPPVKETEKPQAKPNKTPAGQWLVQVGSFSREDNARLLRDKLKNSGYAAYLESAKSDVGPVYRVRIGPATSRTDAEKLVSKLSKQGGYRAIVLADE
jgi:DedD protein